MEKDKFKLRGEHNLKNNAEVKSHIQLQGERGFVSLEEVRVLEFFWRLDPFANHFSQVVKGSEEDPNGKNEFRHHAILLVEFLKPWTVTAGKSLDSCRAFLQ